jgi:hypothetical protein
LSPPLLYTHLWCLEAFYGRRFQRVLASFFRATAIVYTFVVPRNLYGRRLQRVLSLHFISRHRCGKESFSSSSSSSSNHPSIRCNSPSHSKRNQPLAQQEQSAFSAGAISLQHSRRFNCPSTQHEQLPLDQQAQPVLAKQARPAFAQQV